jgi:Putative Actinobacterial Holin-X, holin superfamily III
VIDTNAKTAAPDAAPEAAPSEPGLFDNVVALSRDFQLLAREQFDLAALEARVATRSVVVMIAAAVAVGVLLVSVWLALVAALVWSLFELGLTPLPALLVVAALNLLAGWALVALIRRQGRNLGFPATRRSLAMLIEVRGGTPP